MLGQETPWFGQTVIALTAWDAEGLARLLGGKSGCIRSARLRAHSPVSFTRCASPLMSLPESFPDAPNRLAASLKDGYARQRFRDQAAPGG